MSDQHSEIMQALGRIEQKIDGHVHQDEEVHERQERAVNDLFSKVNTVEKTQARHRGIALGAMGVFSSLLAFIKWNGGA